MILIGKGCRVIGTEAIIAATMMLLLLMLLLLMMDDIVKLFTIAKRVTRIRGHQVGDVVSHYTPHPVTGDSFHP